MRIILPGWIKKPAFLFFLQFLDQGDLTLPSASSNKDNSQEKEYVGNIV